MKIDQTGLDAINAVCKATTADAAGVASCAETLKKKVEEAVQRTCGSSSDLKEVEKCETQQTAKLWTNLEDLKSLLSPLASPALLVDIDKHIKLLDSGNLYSIVEASKYFESHFDSIPLEKMAAVMAALQKIQTQLNQLKGVTFNLNGLIGKFAEAQARSLVKGELRRLAFVPALSSLEKLVEGIGSADPEKARDAVLGLADFLSASAMKMGMKKVRDFLASHADEIVKGLGKVLKVALGSKLADMEAVFAVLKNLRFGLELDGEQVKVFLAATLEALLLSQFGGAPLVVQMLLAAMPGGLENASDIIRTIVNRITPEVLDRQLVALLNKDKAGVREAIIKLRDVAKGETPGSQLARELLTQLPRHSKFVEGVNIPELATDIRRFRFFRHHMQDEVDQWIAQLNSSNPEVRASAADSLGYSRDKRAVLPLIAYLTDESAEVRESVAYAIGYLEDRRAVLPLIERLKDPSPDVRLGAVESLTKLGDNRAVPYLIDRVLDKLESEEVRGKIAQMLGYFDDKRVEKPLLKLLLDPSRELTKNAAYSFSYRSRAAKYSTGSLNILLSRLRYKNVNERSIAAYALGSLEDGKAIGPLVASLKDESSKVRSSAAGALRWIHDYKEFEKHRVKEHLIPLLEDPDEDVRAEAVQALGEHFYIDSQEVLEAVLKSLEDQSISVRKAAAGALMKNAVHLKQMVSDQGIDMLIKLLTDPDDDLRSYSAQALGKLKARKAFDPLVAGLNDKLPKVRASFAEALWNYGNTRAVIPLIAKLADESDDVREAIVEALDNLGDKKAVVPLIERLKVDDSSSVRSKIAEALGRFEDKQILEPLRFCLANEQDSYVKRACMDSLYKMQDKGAVPFLIGRLSDPSPEVRQEAASHLGFLGDKSAVEPLIICLDDPSESVRWGAAGALGQLKDLLAVEPLIQQLMLDEKTWVRSAVLESLGELGDPRAVQPLIVCLNDPDEDIRTSAAGALEEFNVPEAIAALKKYREAHPEESK